jgi:hypothetical protein
MDVGSLPHHDQNDTLNKLFYDYQKQIRQSIRMIHIFAQIPKVFGIAFDVAGT